MIYGWMAKGHIVTNSFPSRNAVISFIIYVVEEGVKNQTRLPVITTNLRCKTFTKVEKSVLPQTTVF